LNRVDARGKTVALTLSGGNADPDQLREALEQGLS
jgi:threonine dehydratase